MAPTATTRDTSLRKCGKLRTHYYQVSSSLDINNESFSEVFTRLRGRSRRCPRRYREIASRNGLIILLFPRTRLRLREVTSYDANRISARRRNATSSYATLERENLHSRVGARAVFRKKMAEVRTVGISKPRSFR